MALTLSDKKYASLVEDNKTAVEQKLPDHKAIGQIAAGIYTSSAPTHTNGDLGLLRLSSDGRLLCDVDITAPLTVNGDVDVSAFKNEAGLQKDAKVNGGDILVVQTGTGTDASAMTSQIATYAAQTDKSQMSRITDGTTEVVVETTGTKKALNVNITDGTNDMPTGDALARGIFVNVGDGTTTAVVETAGTKKALNVNVTDGTNDLPTGDAVGRSIYTAIGDGTTTGIVKAGNTFAVADVSLGVADANTLAKLGTIETDIEATNTALGTVNTNLGTIETDIEATNTKLGTIETDIEATNTALGTVNTNLGTIETDIEAINTKLVTGTVIGDVNAIQSGTWNITNVSGTVSLPTGASTETTLSAVNTKLGTFETAPSSYRTTALDETAAKEIKASAGTLFGYNLINSNAYDVFCKFYNTAAASVVVGTTAIVSTIMVPAQGTVVMKNDQPIQAFSTAISFSATKLVADNDTTALDSDVIAQIYYK